MKTILQRKIHLLSFGDNMCHKKCIYMQQHSSSTCIYLSVDTIF